SALAAAVELDAERAGPGTGASGPPLRALRRRLQHLCRQPARRARMMASVERFLTRRLKLKVNAAKSAVDRPVARKFLGFSFTSGKEPRRIAPQTLDRLKKRIRELTRRTCGRSLAQTVAELARYLVGWRSYFGFCQTP